MNDMMLSALSPEEREYILKNLPNLGMQEDELENQMALANALRTRAPPTRMDWGSQAARALQGVASGMGQHQARKGREALGNQYRDFAANFPGGQQDLLERYRRYSMAAPMGGYG